MTEQDTNIIAMLASGETQSEVARTIGVSQPTISRFSDKHKELILAEGAKFLEEGLTAIRERTIKEITHANNLSTKELFNKDNQPALTRIDKKEDQILKAAGIAPSHAPSIHVQNIFNDNRQTIISDNVSSLLNKITNDTIDIESYE